MFTAITSPLMVKTDPPLPPWVVSASETMVGALTRPMIPRVDKGAISPSRVSHAATLQNPVSPSACKATTNASPDWAGRDRKPVG